MDLRADISVPEFPPASFHWKLNLGLTIPYIPAFSFLPPAAMPALRDQALGL